jgi:hypothetical protein
MKTKKLENLKDTFVSKEFNDILQERISYLSDEYTDVCEYRNISKKTHFILDETTYNEKTNMFLWKMDGQLHAHDYLSSKIKIYDRLRMVHFTIHFEIKNNTKKLVANICQVLQLKNTDYKYDEQVINVGWANENLTTNN